MPVPLTKNAKSPRVLGPHRPCPESECDCDRQSTTRQRGSGGPAWPHPAHVVDYGGLVLPLEPRNDNSRMLVRRVRLNIAKSRSRVGRIPSSLHAWAAMIRSSEPDGFSSQTVCAAKLDARRVAAASAGRFSSVLNFTRCAQPGDPWFPLGPIRRPTRAPPPAASTKDRWQESRTGPLHRQSCLGLADARALFVHDHWLFYSRSKSGQG